MVEWGHFKDASLVHTEGIYLKKDRKGFRHKDPPNNQKQKLLFNTKRAHPDHTTQKQGPGISHKYFGRVGVIPEKSKTRSHERSHEDG